MKTFSIKAILISSGFMANMNIGLFIKNLTSALLKSSGDKKVPHLMPSSKSSASVVLLTTGLAGPDCYQPEKKNSLFFHLFFQYLYLQPANFIYKQDGYDIIFL